MFIANNKNECCGCTACVSICPYNCTYMKEDEEGFFYPYKDMDKCKNCNLCDDVCFYKNQKLYMLDRLSKPISFAAYAKSMDQRMISQSGGLFGIIAEFFLNNGGVVYGAIVNDDFSIVHERVDNNVLLKKIHGSKYVQSDLRGIYFKVKDDLNNGKKVLFSGTPCQVEGLRKYLHRDYDDLFCIDIICYGVPSPILWKSFLHYKCQGKGRIKNVNFRAKEYGWHECKTKIELEDSDIVTKEWTYLWGSGLPLRPSCYSCQFTNIERVGDITLGDCWGAEKLSGLADDVNKGVSLVIINSNKGNHIFEKIREYIECERINLNDFLQPRLTYPVYKPIDREDFWTVLFEHGIKRVLKIYGNSEISMIRRFYIMKRKLFCLFKK